MKFNTKTISGLCLLFVSGLSVLVFVFIFIVSIKIHHNTAEEVQRPIIESAGTVEVVTQIEAQITVKVEMQEPVTTPTVTIQIVEESTTEEQKGGFTYYQIPEDYARYGGDFPEEVQSYLWQLCEDAGVNYYIVVALIERESGYKQNATGDRGNSKGYMQIYEKWHTKRMQAESVDDLYNPYGNIRVGVNLLTELLGRADGDYHYVLMSYNMGESRTKSLYSEGVCSTNYSRGILQRAQEIEQELQD